MAVAFSKFYPDKQTNQSRVAVSQRSHFEKAALPIHKMWGAARSRREYADTNLRALSNGCLLETDESPRP